MYIYIYIYICVYISPYLTLRARAEDRGAKRPVVVLAADDRWLCLYSICDFLAESAVSSPAHSQPYL